MTCSLIITTYNWKNALELVLLSALNQSILPDEIIIADDGSNTDTKELIHKFAQTSQIPIFHSWQEDDGFRAAMSRNKAIAKASGKYIILTDGDMILHHNFIKDHLCNAKQNCFIQGSRVLLSTNKSQSIMSQKKISFHIFEYGISNRKNMIHSNILSKLFSYQSKTLTGIKTCNMSFFKSDCLKVNGFNEDFIGWGREDSEFVVRLLNSGIKRKNIKFNCVAFHLWHNENDRASLPQNDTILRNTIEKKLVWYENGIDKHLKGLHNEH